jgi:hypothetical protein
MLQFSQFKPRTAMTASILTVDPATTGLGYRVSSSAIDRIAVTAGDLPGTHNLLVFFNSNPSKGYRYAFEDDGAARRWIDLLQDDEARVSTSWGREFNRALKHGDIEPIEV